MFFCVCKQGAAPGQCYSPGRKQETRSSEGIEEKDKGDKDAHSGSFAFHVVLVASLDPHDDNRLCRLGWEPAGPSDQLHLPLRTLASFLELQRQPHHLWLLQ